MANHPHNSGAAPSHRRALTSLAKRIREHPEYERQLDDLYAIAGGRHPVSGEVVDAKTMLAAKRLLFEYGHGVPAQHVIVEAELRALSVGVRATFDPTRLNAAQLEALAAVGAWPDVGVLKSGDDGSK